MSEPTAPPPPTKRSVNAVVAGLLVGVLVFALGLGAVVLWQSSSDKGPSATPFSPSVSPPSTSPTGPMPETDPRLARFYHQKLDWQQCTGGFCTRLTVPLDYAHPGGRTIRIAVVRVPARDQVHKVGDLVINPGGPGESGLQYAAAASLAFGKPLLDHFDIVGFDPRGVGQSDPLECLSTAALDRFIAADPDPATAAGRARMDRLTHGFGEACLRRSGDLARHISTPEAARDIDILRAALGQSKLDYFGASYGTFLGATYANLFPTHVGRMVLDGAIDPKLSNLQLSLAQAHGFEVALRSYAQYCIDKGNCVLGNTVDAATHRVRTLLDQIGRHPLPTSDPKRPLTAGLATLGVWMPLYVKSWWDQLTLGLQQAIQDHRGSVLLAMADLYTARGGNGYTDNSVNALYAVNCLDHDDYIPTSQVPSYFPRFEKASPTFGRDFAFSLSTCSTWPIKTHRHTTALHAKGAPPILVVGTTRDPATPLAWAKGLASELDSGVLLTRNGDGHTAYHQNPDNPCIDDTVEAYLVSGTVPPNGKAC